MSDSVANLTVKVDVKSVAAATKALESLASKAGVVHQQMQRLGSGAAAMAKGQEAAEKKTRQSESAFEKMNRRLEDGAKKYQQITRLINQHALAEGVRAGTMARLNRSFEDFNRTASKVNASNKDLRVSTRLYNDQIDKLKDGIATVARLEKQRVAETKKNAAETVRTARELAAIEKKRVADALSFERIMQQAQTRASGITGRAARQVSPEQFSGISASTTNALNQYQSALRTYGLNSIGATKATGEFNRAMQALSGDIARVGGLLPRISDNARVLSAAFGAANASVNGFSRAIFNTNAALAALGGAFALREFTNAIVEFEKFTNTLRTVSNTSGEFQRNLQFLTNEANRIGFSVGEVGNSFARLSLAMKGAGFSGDETRTSFTQLTEAARNFGLSSADTMGVIRALEQSMSKGKFMAEEVRLQLGDRLPIAMAALDKAVTVVDGRQADLNKRFEEGSLDVKRYGSEFIRQINLMSGGADALSRTSNSISASFGRLGTEFSLFSNALGEGGLSNAVVTFSNSLAETLKTLREIGATETIGAVFAALGDTVLFVIKGLTEFIRLLKEIGALDVLNWVLGTISKLAQEFSGLIGSTNRFTSAINEVNRTSARVNDSISEFNEVLFRNKQALDSSSTAIERRIEANKRLGMSEGDAIAAAAKAELQRIEIERSRAQRELAAAERAAATMRRGLTPRVRVVGTTLQNIETALESATPLTRPGLESQRQAFAAANPIVNDFLNGTLSALDAVNKLNAAFKGKEIPDAIDEIRTKLVEASLDTKFQATTDALIAARKRVSDLDQSITEFANKFASGVYVQFTIDIIRQQEGGARATVGSLSDIEQTAFRALSDTQSIAKKAEAIRTALRETGLDKTADGLERFANIASMSDKELIKTVRTSEAFRNVLPKVAGELDNVKIAEEGRAVATERSTETLDKYLATLNAQIRDQGEIAAAYRISTAAGEDAEIQLKAETEAIRLGAKTDAQRIALKKQILPLLRDEAAGEASIRAAKDLPQMRDEIALLEKEQSLLGAGVALREQELAVLRTRQQYRGSKPEDLAEIERNIRSTVTLRQQNQFLENSYNEVANIGTRAFEQVGDAITEAFSKGELRALRFGDIVRGVMSSIIQSIIRLGIINPILNNLFPGGGMRPTFGGAMAAAAGGGGGGGSILSGLGQIFSAGRTVLSTGSLLGGAGGFAGYGAGMSGVLFGTPAIPAGMAGAGGATMSGGAAATSGLLGGGGQFSMAALGSTLGLAAGGFGAGTFANSLLGGNQTSGMIGSAIGTGIGLALTPILGPFAPILGGLIGGAGGGMIGPKPSSKGFSYNLGTQGGRLAPIDYRYFNEQGRAQFQEAEAGVASTNALLQQFGLTATGGRAVGGNRFGMGNLGYGEAASFSEAFKSLQFAATSNEELSRALSTRAFEGVEKLQEFLQGFVGLQETIKSLTADPVPDFKQQMDALINSFAEATAKAREYGIGEEDLLVARDKQIAKLEEQRNLTIRDTALELEVRRLMAQGMDQEAERIELAYRTQKEIESFTASLETLGITAGEKSRLLIELEQVQALERAKILKESTKDIRDYLDSLKTGPLAGATVMGRLASSQDLFARDLSAAQSGDTEALGRVTQTADVLLNLAREAYGSTSGFQNIRGGVVSGLEGLLTTAQAAPPLADLSSVPLVSELRQMRDEAAILEAVQYSKQFDEKLGSLLPIAEAIQQAVEQSKEAAVALYDYVSAGGGGDVDGDIGGPPGPEPTAELFALGGVFRHGRVTAYANGGLPDFVNSPTMAPMALFGEAGPEAIMPLRRGPDGRLGVEVNGSGNQAVVVELRAVRQEIINLRGSVEEADSNEGGGVVEAIGELRIQIGGLREELRTNRLRAQ